MEKCYIDSILKFSISGELEWCNSVRKLEATLGVTEVEMHDTAFDAWLGSIRTAGADIHTTGPISAQRAPISAQRAPISGQRA